ncbi:MAG: RNA ligase family protein, partial [Candidatus Buchananbacteria bacterium]
MIEYPSIINSSKSPKDNMIAFEKIDGSNIRVKWTAKKGFCLFGSRTQLIDETHPHLGGVIKVFNKISEPLHEYFSKEYKRSTKVDEVIVFGEYYGPNSFAGLHYDPVEEMMFSAFDVMLIYKSRGSFLLPQDFIKYISPLVPTPKVVYEGNLTDQFVLDVRNNQLEVELNEG